MRTEVLERSDGEVRLLLEDANVKFVNALRRTIITEVPTLAVDEVSIYENSSVLFDEIIAHRLGMLPIVTPKEVLDKPNIEVELTLEAEGSKKITSGDLETDDPEIGPANPNIPLIQLGNDQKISLIANVTLGEGKDHAKWQPGAAYYKKLEKLVFDCSEEVIDIEELKERYSDYEVEEEGDELRVIATERVNVPRELEEFVETEEVPGSYVFTVESNGELPIKLMLTKALNVLCNKSEEFINMIEEVR